MYRFGRLVSLSLLGIFGIAGVCPSAFAQEDSSKIVMRMREILGAMDSRSRNFRDIFTEGFSKNVSANEVALIFDKLHSELGSCDITGRSNESMLFVENYLLKCERGFILVDISIEKQIPI